MMRWYITKYAFHHNYAIQAENEQAAAQKLESSFLKQWEGNLKKLPDGMQMPPTRIKRCQMAQYRFEEAGGEVLRWLEAEMDSIVHLPGENMEGIKLKVPGGWIYASGIQEIFIPIEGTQELIVL